jgi:anti-sigma B factor antagonist
MQLSLRTYMHGDVAVVDVAGNLDAFTAARLRDACTRLLRAGHHDLVLDLDAVTFIDSSGIGVLVGTLRKAKALGGDLRLVCASQQVHRVFKLTGLGKMFTIYPSRDAVFGATPPPPALSTTGTD